MKPLPGDDIDDETVEHARRICGSPNSQAFLSH